MTDEETKRQVAAIIARDIKVPALEAEIARLREEPTLTITRAQYDEFVESAEDHTILWTDTLALIGVYVAPCQTKIDVQDSRPNKGQ